MVRVTEKTTDAETDLVRTRAEEWLAANGFDDARVDVYLKNPGEFDSGPNHSSAIYSPANRGQGPDDGRTAA